MESGANGVTGKKDATITKVDGVMDVDEADKKDGAEAVSDAGISGWSWKKCEKGAEEAGRARVPR